MDSSILATSLGALQIGIFVSHVLFGVTTTQTYIYYTRFPEDSPKLKALVRARQAEKVASDHRA
jgi:adenine-specific DNA glycosylase